LTGTANIDASGTSNGDYIDGNRGANVLYGLAGADTMNGGLGHDVLYGDDGADNLGGEGGKDTLYGGSGADTLNGGAGGDVMYGGADNDTYVFDHIDDFADESALGSSGTDLIQSLVSVDLTDTAHVKGQIEKLTLQGSAAISGAGNGLANVIIGNTGANVLDGRGGNDTLSGGSGADQFTFTTKANNANNHDTIKGFSHGVDKIALDNAIFDVFASTGALSAANFATNAPADGNDYIIYNTTSGNLYYDADGNGAGVALLVATLDGVPGLTQADISII
jgi:Ca2+-binding RTX toxin-like protein